MIINNITALIELKYFKNLCSLIIDKYSNLRGIYDIQMIFCKTISKHLNVKYIV